MHKLPDDVLTNYETGRTQITNRKEVKAKPLMNPYLTRQWSP